MNLGPRCAACVINRYWTSLIKEQDLLSDGSIKCCIRPRCMKPAILNTKLCQPHLLKLRPIDIESRSPNMANLQRCVSRSLSRRWRSNKEIDVATKRVTEIWNGKQPGADMVVIDIEFMPSTGQVLEVAVIEYVSGKILVDTRISYNSTLPLQTGVRSYN